MNAAKENLHHELYLRAASAAKKNAPLKLHANVVGKFQVERQLDNDVRSRLRKTTKTLQEQRQERGIIQLEAPPAHLASKTSKKSAAGVKNKQPRLLSNLAKTGSRDPAAYKAKNAAPMPVQRRMIQLLAVQDRTAEEIVKSLSGLDFAPSDRLGILDLLEQLAEVSNSEGGVNSKPSKFYRLKLKTWTDFRPIEWDWSSEHERSTVSTRFESALRRMSIPESNTVRKHTLHRDGKDNLSSLPATTKQSVPTPRVASGSSKTETSQRALATVGAKDKRVKSGKTDPGNEQISKDGTIHTGRSLSAHGKIQAHETIPLPPAPKASAPLRKPPGSGFRSSKASTPTTSPPATDNPVRGHRDGGSKNRDPPSLLQGQSVATTAGRQLEPNAAARRTHKTEADTGRSHSGSKKIPESMGKGGADSRVVEAEGTVQKRRTITRDLEGNDTREPIPKKRKVDRNLVDNPYPSSNENGPGGQVSKKIVKKSEPSVRHKLKDDPIPTSRHQTKASSPSSSLLHDNFSSGQNANTKPVASSRRRRSPIYTSSDDDNESMQTSKDVTSQQALPTDHASLRRRYNKSYSEYLTAFQKLVTVKNKIDGILGTRDANNANFVSESDVDTELMDPEEFRRLCSRHKRLRDELESIQQLFSQNNARVITT
ncbi:hypothetical protein JOM56_002316 [Amanita muscaria]